MAVLGFFPEGTLGIQHPVSEHPHYSGIVGKTGMKTCLLFFFRLCNATFYVRFKIENVIIY